MKNSVKMLMFAAVVAFSTTACNTGQQATTAANNSTIDSLKLTLEILKMQQAVANTMAGTTGSNVIYGAANNATPASGYQSVDGNYPPPRTYQQTQNGNNGGYTDYDRTTAPVINTSERIVQPQKKMNEVTKGVLIGAGVGAVSGAIIAKKKGKGALIGGVLGAASGGVAGKIIKNRKENRATDNAVDKLLASF